MSINTGAYRGARSCTAGPQPGSWGAMDYYLAAYADNGGVNTGIYNCRSVRGGKTTSLHGEGRAADFGVRPYGAKYGTALANALVAFSDELGIQCVIWNRKIWSSQYPHSGWRRYSGQSAHTDHIHVEFTWARAKAGRAATAKLYAKVLGGVKPGDIKVGGGGSSKTWESASAKHDVGSRVMSKYDGGTDVRWLQKRLYKIGYDPGVRDGQYGDDVIAAVRKLQGDAKIDVDGKAGGDTIAAAKAADVVRQLPKPKPKPKPSVPGKKYSFPYGNGYIGPKSGPDASHSGIGGRKTKGVFDRTHNKRWVNQLVNRGWDAFKGGDYLEKFGNDGKYGAELADLIRAFQKDQKLKVTGRVDRKTWDAAFKNTIK